MSRRFYINFLAFFLGFFFMAAAVSAFADCASDWIAGAGAATCANYQGGCQEGFYGNTVTAEVALTGVLYSCSLDSAPPPTSGPASNGGTGCNSGIASGYSIPTPSGIGPLNVSMGGCEYAISTQGSNADGSRVGGIAISTGVATGADAAAATGSVTPTGARRVINIDGSVTTTTVQNIPDGSGGSLTQVTESTVPAGGGTPVVSTSIGSGSASPGTSGGGGGGGGGAGGVGGLGTSPTTGGVKTSTETETPAATATQFVAPSPGGLPSVSSGWYTSKYAGGLHGVWDARKAALFATPLGAAIANMAVPIGAGSEPTWTFTLWRISGTYTLALPSWLWGVVKAILLLSSAFACRRIIFGG